MKSDPQDTDIVEKIIGDQSGIDPVAIGDKPSAFLPQTEEEIGWVVEKIVSARARADRIWIQAEVMAKQAEAEAEYFLWKYGSHLQAYARRELEGKKRKSIALFHGTIGFKSKNAEVKIKDHDAAYAWAVDNLPDAIFQAVDPGLVKRALKDSGEVVDFAEYTPAKEEFFIK